MRRRIYVEGRPVWSDPEPSEFPEEMPRLYGSFVQGAPGPVEQQRRSEAARKARIKADPERYAQAQARWHRSKVKNGHAQP